MTMSKAVDAPCIKVAVVAGAAANTNIAVTGIETEDILIAVFEFATAAAIATLANQTPTTSITSSGNIQSTATTTNNSLMVFWHDASA